MTPSFSWAYRITGSPLEEVSDAFDLAGIEPLGLSEDRGVTTAWFEARPAEPMPLPGSWEQVERADWAEKWKEGLEPVTVGRVTVVPPWLAEPGSGVTGPVGPGEQVVVVIEPGLAFGTGHHETTMGCLGALQEVDLAGKHVIDIGTGTGVLAFAARGLGAASVVGVDIDPEAIDVARENLELHGIDGITLAVGSCEAAGPPADVVVANIITDKLFALVPDLVRLVVPGGVLLCSGVALDRSDEAVEVFTAAGAPPVVRPGREWSVVIAHRPGS